MRALPGAKMSWPAPSGVDWQVSSPPSSRPGWHSSPRHPFCSRARRPGRTSRERPPPIHRGRLVPRLLCPGFVSRTGLHHPAAEILAEFGALDRRAARGGQECGPNDITFWELWPDESILQVWADLLGTRLVGIADLHHGHGELYAADDGRLFGRSCVHDAFWLEGGSFS